MVEGLSELQAVPAMYRSSDVTCLGCEVAVRSISFADVHPGSGIVAVSANGAALFSLVNVTSADPRAGPRAHPYSAAVVHEGVAPGWPRSEEVIS